MSRIAVCLADMGTVDCLLGAVDELRSLGVDIYVDPVGAGKKALDKKGAKYVEAERIDPSPYDLVVCGTNGKAQMLQRNATIAAKEASKTVIWCGDFYLSGCEVKMRDFTPDWLTVIDDSAKELAHRARPDIPADRVAVCGNSSFDRISGILQNQAEIREEVRTALGLQTDQKLVIFSASASNQFSEEEMVITLEELKKYRYRYPEREVSVVASFHPADTKKESLVSSAEVKGLGVRDRITGDSLKDMAGADAVVVQYSTERVKGSLLVPTAFVLLPSMRDYQRTRGGRWPFFPQIETRVAEGVWDPQELAPALDRMLWGEPDYYEFLVQARKKHFSSLMDGGAGLRLATFIRMRFEEAIWQSSSAGKT